MSQIKLSLHPGDYPGSSADPAFLDVEVDADSDETPPVWIWLMFASESKGEPWFKLTFREASLLRIALNKELEMWDQRP